MACSKNLNAIGEVLWDSMCSRLHSNQERKTSWKAEQGVAGKKSGMKGLGFWGGSPSISGIFLCTFGFYNRN